MYIVQYVWEAERESKKTLPALLSSYLLWVPNSSLQESKLPHLLLIKQTDQNLKQPTTSKMHYCKEASYFTFMYYKLSIGLENKAKNIIIIIAKNIFMRS